MSPQLVLSLAQMGKFFTHFGIRSLLILYMLEELKYGSSHALALSALFCAAIELGGLVGGYLADRILGLKKALLLGGGLLTIGYLLLPFYLSAGMALVITGGSLFAPTITALLGQIYENKESDQERGFTLFYMMQNLGALLATVFCGFVATLLGYKVAFLCAGVGLIGFLPLLCKHKILPEKKVELKKSKVITVLSLFSLVAYGMISFVELSETILPLVTIGLFLFFLFRIKHDLYPLFIYLISMILFFAAEDQICSSLLLLAAEKDAVVPISLLTTLNPLVIILLGTFITKKGYRLSIPFLLNAIAFSVLVLFGDLPFLTLALIVVVISIAELMVGPKTYSEVAKISLKGNAGQIMGLMTVSFSLAFQLSGYLSQVASKNQTVGFGTFALLSLLFGALLPILIKQRKRLLIG